MNKTNTRRKTGVHGLISVLILLLATLLLLGVFSSATAARAYTPGADEEEATTTQETGYLFNITIQGRDVWLTDNSVITASKWGEFGGTKRYTLDATVIFVLQNVKSKAGKRIIVTASTQLNFPARFPGFDKRIQFAQDIKVNIRKTYYDLMQDKDLTLVSATWFYDTQGYTLFSSSGCYESDKVFTLAEAKTTTGIIDPDDPGDNGGEDNTPITDKPSMTFWEWFVGIWGSTKWYNILFQILFCFIGLFAIGLTIKLIRWLVGLFK